MSQQINLFNPAFEKQAMLFSAKASALACGVLVLGLAAMGAWAELRVLRLQAEAKAVSSRLAGAQKRLASVSVEFTPRQKDPALPAQLAEAERQHAALQHVAQVIERGELGNTQGYAEYFRALARQHVEGLWLTGVSIGGAGREIGVQGRALDPALVPGFIGRLRNEPVMQGKAVGSLQIGEAVAAKPAGKDGKDNAAPVPYIEFSLQSAPAGATP
jgi:hypothetical protein